MRLVLWILVLLAAGIGALASAFEQAGGDSALGAGIMSFAYFAVLTLIYLIPSFLALHRSHPNVLAISVLNVFSGWTFLGWVGALVWASTKLSSGEARGSSISHRLSASQLAMRIAGVVIAAVAIALLGLAIQTYDTTLAQAHRIVVAAGGAWSPYWPVWWPVIFAVLLIGLSFIVLRKSALFDFPRTKA